MIEYLTALCIASVIANILLVMLNLKMYTEYFKEKAISNRSK